MSCALISNVRSGTALVERFLERRHADATVRREEILTLVAAQPHIGGDDRGDRFDHILARKAWARNLADRGGLVAGAAQRDLVRLFAGAFEPKNADMTDVMMA